MKNALTYARRNHLSGVHDVVAMLLHVPREYETAMVWRWRGHARTIVTQTEQDAKQMIVICAKTIWAAPPFCH